jgi:hypothetical protein
MLLHTLTRTILLLPESVVGVPLFHGNQLLGNGHRCRKPSLADIVNPTSFFFPRRLASLSFGTGAHFTCMAWRQGWDVAE